MSDERIHLSIPHLSGAERDYALAAIDGNWLAMGPDLPALETAFAEAVGAEHALALSSGTAALHLALRLAGVGPGDVVLTSTLTFAATANAVRYLGAEPVFVDVDPVTWMIDPALVAAEVEARAAAGAPPRAVVTVDLYGQCADHDPILEVCNQHGVAVIEDAAESLGATYRGRSAGTLAPFGAFSFNGNKIITSGGGGMLVGQDSDAMARARSWAAQARDPAPHYQHSELGYNYRMSNLLAAVARAQLAVLPERVAARQAINARYVEALADLPGLSFLQEAPHNTSTHWLTCVLLDAEAPMTTEALRLHLDAAGIEARPVWKPMHLQPLYQGCAVRGGAVAEDLFGRGLCLPSGSSLSPAQQDRVVAAIRAAWS